MEEIRSIHELAYFNLLRTGSWIEKRVKEALKPYNLTHAQLNVLYILKENDPEPVSAGQLREGILVTHPDITRLLDRLVMKGYIIRETCPENRRKIDISLTKEGRRLFSKAHLAARHAVGNFLEKLITEEEARELRRILHKLKE
jgi:DNA-binding MarR family transcriptional regulator